MAAARTSAFMLAMQRQDNVHMANYYDARIGESSYSGMFNPDTWTTYKTYYAFMSFNKAYELKNEVASDDQNVHVLAAAIFLHGDPLYKMGAVKTPPGTRR